MAKKWTDYLTEEVYNRLCDCRNKKSDIEEMMYSKWKFEMAFGKDKEWYTIEDALIYVLELLDCNSQDNIADLTIEEYNELLGR